jgi:hypothetical protein
MVDEHATPRDEIEITPEMIEAGADVIRSRDLDFYRAAEVAEEVFKTMLSCTCYVAAGSASEPHKHRT